MSRLVFKPRELPAILIAVIIIALIKAGYLDQHQWAIWLIIAAIPTWVILGRRQTQKNAKQIPSIPDEESLDHHNRC